MWYPSKDRTDQLDAQLASFEETPSSSDGRLEDFLVRISACVRHLALNKIVPPSYLRDWIWIGSQYRLNLGKENRAQSIARRALLFLEQSLSSGADCEAGFHRSINWITDSTVADLRAQLGPNEYNSFLSPAESGMVENRLLDLRCDTSKMSDEEEATLETYLQYFADVSSEVYLPGIADMILRLRNAVRANGEGQSVALSCLRYVLDKHDVVPDTLGYLGLVDDIHAIEHTYREIENRTTWTPLLERLNLDLPYVARTAFDDGSETVRCSPYMQAVFGMALHSLHHEGKRTCLILPEPGIIGLIGAFFACVESIRSQATANGDSSHEFVPYDHILFEDAELSVRAKYAGTLEREGIAYHAISLKGSGRITVPEHILGLAHRPAKPHRSLSSVREFAEWRKKYSPTPLTHLVEREFRFDDLRPEVLLLTRRNRLDDLIPEIRPMGRTIPELVGIKYITSTGTEEGLPGTNLSDPLIWSCSDAATARELVASTDSGLFPRYVIIDDCDLAADFEDNLAPSDAPEQTSWIAFAGLHEREAVRRLLDQKYESWILRQADVDLVPGSSLRPHGGRIGTVSRFQLRQAIQARVTSEIHDIACEPVELLYQYLRELRKKLGENQDPQLEVVAIAASGFIRRFIRPLLEFNELESEELRGLLKILFLHCGTLADFLPDVRDLGEYVKVMLEGDLPRNPRQETIQELIANSAAESIAVVCPSAQAAASATTRTEKNPVLGRASWLSLRQLRQAAPFAHLIVPGWIDRSAMRELRRSGYGNHMDLVLYDFEREWETSSRIAAQSWERRLASQTRRQWRSLGEEFGELPELAELTDERPEEVELEEVIEDEADDEFLEERIIETIRRKFSYDQPGKVMAKARLVTFEEAGTYIFLPPYGNVISLSRAFEAVALKAQQGDIDVTGSQAEKLISCPVSEIRRGDLLAFPADSTSDLLDNLANRFIQNSAETRRLAGLWRTSLLSYLESTGKDVLTLQKELENAGLKRHPLTIRMWVTRSDVVAPMSYPEAVSVVGGVTGHSELKARIEDVKSAIDLVYRGRSRAAEELLNQLARRNIELHEGNASVIIEGQEIRYRLRRVLSIDHPVDVPQDEIGVLRNIADLPSGTSPEGGPSQ